jgi:hypothetical protein
MNYKLAYGWVVNWGDVGIRHLLKEPNVTVDLFFSSLEKFYELYGCNDAKAQILVPVHVPLDFNNWDYIPDNY